MSFVAGCGESANAPATLEAVPAQSTEELAEAKSYSELMNNQKKPGQK